MQRLMSVLLVGVAAGACGGSADGGSPMGFPDAAGALDAGANSDGAAFQGLTIEWVDSPDLPGSLNISTMVTVSSAKFHVKKLEAIGDGGAVPETTQDEFDVVWNATTSPPLITFFNAPPAIYSKIRLSLDKGSSNAPSIEIAGTVLVNGTTETFLVTTTQKKDIEVDGYAVILDIGESEGMPIIVGLDALLADVDWMSLPMTNNVRTLDDTRGQDVDALLDHLEDTFSGPLE